MHKIRPLFITIIFMNLDQLLRKSSLEEARKDFRSVIFEDREAILNSWPALPNKAGSEVGLSRYSLRIP